jgi:hypothetical protein
MAKGKSPNPPEDPAEKDAAKRATTALIVDIALREGSLLARRAVHHKLAGGDFTDVKNAALPRASFPKRVAAATLARLAARSLPGTLLVAGGLVAKALFDRRRSRGKGVEEAGE